MVPPPTPRPAFWRAGLAAVATEYFRHVVYVVVRITNAKHAPHHLNLLGILYESTLPVLKWDTSLGGKGILGRLKKRRTYLAGLLATVNARPAALNAYSRTKG